MLRYGSVNQKAKRYHNIFLPTNLCQFSPFANVGQCLPHHKDFRTLLPDLEFVEFLVANVVSHILHLANCNDCTLIPYIEIII